MVRSPSEAGSDSETDQPANAAKTPTIKDKTCQYCHQQFTSSSLGRHLDQFIFKKKPDGIHNVDEIKALRGGITRRTARSGKKDTTRDLINEINQPPPGGLEVRLNRVYWQSTGVITDPAVLNRSATSPPSASATAATGASAASLPLPKKRSYSSFATDLNPTSVADSARALELALREVLDSLRAASKHLTPRPSPFSFDITSQTFPSLCLLLLPTPPTLFQAAPFATFTSCPISPPGPEQLAAVRTRLTGTIDMWKWNALRLAQPTTSNIADEADFLSRQAASWTETSFKHLDSSYQNWMSHLPDTRALLWNTELLRAFQSQKDRVCAIEEDMERLQQEANQLQQQVEYLSLCQWPREMAQWPPERHTYSKKMREELRLVNPLKPPPRTEGESEPEYLERLAPGGPNENVNTRIDKWDFDKLVSKWKTHVREDRGRRAMANALPAAPPPPPSSVPRNGVSAGVTAKDGSLPPGLKRVKANGAGVGGGDGDLQQNGDSLVNGIVNVDKDGKELGERRAPRRNLTKNITALDELTIFVYFKNNERLTTTLDQQPQQQPNLPTVDKAKARFSSRLYADDRACVYIRHNSVSKEFIGRFAFIASID
ncbi:hypothetical protein DV736_g171, partial [Chaetothyriales sp. CBS 134916]